MLVSGDKFEVLFNSKDVGETNGVSEKLNKVGYFIRGMKEPDYSMKIMCTCGHW